MDWFDDISTIDCTHTGLVESILVKKRNVRYTPSEKSRALSKSSRLNKRFHKKQKNENISISVVTRDPERNVCLINQEEIEKFLNLICKHMLFYTKLVSIRSSY